MVQFVNLPERTSLGTQFGRSVGEGIAKGGEQGFQRGMLQKALNELSGKKYENPLDLVNAYLYATAGLPDQGKILQAALPFAMSRLSGETSKNIPPPPGAAGNIPGGMPNQEVPTTKTTDPQQYLNQARKQENLDLPEPLETPDIFKGTLEPTSLGMGPIPPTYTPEQIQQVEFEDLQRGFPTSLRAQKMNEYNELSRSRINDIVNAANIQSSIAEQAATRQGQRRGVLESRLGINDPSDLAVAERMGKDIKQDNDALWADQVAKKYEKYATEKDEFKRSMKRPNPILYPDEYKNKINNAKSKGQVYIDNGQRDQLYKDAADDGWSESEIAKQFNPLPDLIKSKIDNLPSPQQFTGADQERAMKEMYSFLEKNVKPGKLNPRHPDILDPGVSLLLIRNELMKKGYTYQTIDNAVSNLINQGKIHLDDYQNREFQMMNQSPARTMSIYEMTEWGEEK